jgi:hypothetical protein
MKADTDTEIAATPSIIRPDLALAHLRSELEPGTPRDVSTEAFNDWRERIVGVFDSDGRS